MNKRIKFIFFLMACLMPLAMVAQQTHWTPQGAAYEDNMTLTGVIQINGVEQQSAALEVGAFCGTECRGAVRAVLFPATQRYVVMLTIFGNNGDQITFKLYDHNQGMELNYQSPAAVTFGSNGLGTLMNPYVLNFTSPEYTISASASPSNGGTISGAGTYPSGSTCTLTATPATGYSFVRWTKNGSQVSTNPSYSFTVTGNASYVAVFSLNSYTISASSSPSAGGSVSGAGSYNYGSTCTLTATANTGYTFVRWTKNGTQVSTSPSYSFTVTGNASYVAVFSLNSYTISVSANPSEGGTVSGGGTYNYGSSCTLTATPATGYSFVRWTKNGSQVSTNPSYSFTVTGNASYVAVFSQNSYTISASANPTAGGSVSGAGNYNYGATCNLTATANTGYTFTNWTKNGTVVSTSASYSFTVTSNGTYVANFEAENIIVFADPNVKAICVANWDTNGSGELSYAEAAAVTSLGLVFRGDTTITSFEELQYFTGLNVIDSYAFENCNNLASIAIPNDVSSIGQHAFYNCGSLTGPLTIPHTIVYFGSQAFTNCGSISAIYYTGDIAQWCNIDFSSYTSNPLIYAHNLYINNELLTELVIPETITEIKSSTFVGASCITGPLVIPSSVTTIGMSAFYECSGITSLIIPNSVTSIGSYAFWMCSGITGDLVIPNSVTSIGMVAFLYCTGLTSLSIGSAVTSIGNSAFAWCSNLTSLVINSSNMSLDDQSFQGCSNLNLMTIYSEIPPTIGSNTFQYVSTDIPVYVPCGSINAYQSAEGWSAFTNYQCINHEYVDLGLPSGTLWATYNVGAYSPEEYGDYFAWGETQTKDNYDWSTYQYCMGSENTLTKYCNDAWYGYNGFTDNLTTLQSSDDAATVSWGMDWRMPTEEEWQELYNNTTSIWMTQNGVNGRLFTASNGNSIFLPAAGCHDGISFNNTFSNGYYWSNSLDTNQPNIAWSFNIRSGNNFGVNNFGRFYGQSVRAVRNIFHVTVSSNPAEGGSIEGAGTYDNGSTCTLTATANEGYTFINWTENGEVVFTEATYSFTVIEDRDLVANFLPVYSSLSDDFNDNVIDTTVWTYQGSTVYEDEGLMKIEQNVTDNDVRLTTLPMLLTPSGQIVMERSFKVHRANNYFSGGFAINFNGVGDEASYIRVAYWHEAYAGKYGTYVDASIDGEVTEVKLCDAVFDTWLTEKVIVDKETGRLVYYLNNELVAVVPINGLASKEVSYYTIKFWPYGWWTGHYHYMDYVNINVNQDDLPGVFSVSENNQVNFSQGNLQYQASTNTWRFAEHQWDYMGGDNANISETNSGWIDLFGWGTSGYNHGAGCYQPWSTSETYSDYYAYGDETYNLYDQTGQADWGYNAISNGGNITNIWRTLTREEWSYVFHTRNTPSGIRYAMAQVNNVNGIILLPDDWSSSYYSLNNTNNGASFATNVISSSDWMNSLQAHGAVFLPAAGLRHGTSNINSVGSFGYYWSASRQDSRYAILMEFWEGESWPVHSNAYYRSNGQSVRLVRPAGYYFFSINATPSSTEGGTIEGAGTYEACSTCTLTATANTGYTFVHWTENGEVVSTESTYSFIVTRERNLEAFFSPPLNITALANPSVSGTVSLSTDFENQQIPSNWTNDATFPWVITTPEYSGYNGSFCMMSGNGGVHSSTSSIEVTVDFIQDGSISFIAGCWGEGSSTIWDKCRFYIDDIEQFNYGAQQSWNSYYYEVPVGTHTFRWSYSKDSSVHPTGDAFFVDDITFTGTSISNQFNYGQTCTLSATPNEGYLFLNWNRNGEVLSCNANYSFNVTESIDLEAVFMPLNGRLVGVGEATNQYLPSYSYYCYTLSQQIYTPDEIGAAGSILTISYFNAGETKTRSYDIYMIHTDKNTFENNTDWITVTEADRVFSGEVTMTKGYWNTILLDTSFDYDGTSNLAIIVDDNSGNWSSNHMYCRVFNANGNQAIRVYSDGTNYDPNNPSGYGGTLHSVKNQMIFGIMPAYHFVTAGTWGNAANWSGGALPGVGDAVFIDANCALNRDAEVALLSVTPGQVLTLRPGKTLSVTGNLFNTDIEGLVVEDGAQLVNTSYNVAATVKKNVQAYNNSNPDGWYTISSPMNGMDIEGSNFLTSGYDLYRFNETNLTHDEWENYKVNLADFTTFEKGRGYLYANSNTFAPAFTGILNNLDVTYTLTCTERPNDPLSGFNLIGNPFPHEIYKGAGGAINNVNLASGYYTLTNEGTWEVHSFDDAIQPGQGFLVKATAPTVLTIAKSNEVAFSESGDAKKGVTERMCISVAGDNGQDRTYVYFGQGVGLDKKNDFDAQVPNLWIRDNGHDYAIAHVEDTDESLELCFSNRQEGDFTLAITTSDTEFEYLQLIDRAAGVTVDLLKQSVYTFHSERNEGTKRFTLAFKKK